MKKPIKSTGSDYPCVKCDNAYTRIIDTRMGGKYRRRRRQCSSSKCRHRFTTFEFEEDAIDDLMIKARLFDEIRVMTGKVA